jgi:hypothetical protein
MVVATENVPEPVEQEAESGENVEEPVTAPKIFTLESILFNETSFSFNLHCLYLLEW